MSRQAGRALLVAAPVVALALLVVLLMGQADRHVGAAIGALVGTLVLVILLAWAWRADTVVLDAVSAYALGQVRAPQLFTEVAAAAKQLRVPVPAITCSRADTPFAFVVGRDDHHATLCVSQGLLDRATPDVLRAVVMHELAHLASAGLTSRSIATSWSCGVLALTDGHWVLSRLNPIGVWVRALGVAPAQQMRADALAGRHLADPLAMARALRWLDAGVGRARLAPAGRLVAASGLMTVSPFGNDVRAAALAGQPDTGLRVLRLEALAGYRR
jgi:heat shock protein HtpX